uniref:Uncharacterized protein n=1 Tax=Arundo donax TaxID=35708 RepID=A0A0A9DSV2_ARUDO
MTNNKISLYVTTVIFFIYSLTWQTIIVISVAKTKPFEVSLAYFDLQITCSSSTVQNNNKNRKGA